MNTEPDKIKKFTDLHAWQKGHGLVLMVYKITEEFPGKEMYSLVDQMRRVAVSLTSNIAEGFSRRSSKDLKRKIDFMIWHKHLWWNYKISLLSQETWGVYLMQILKCYQTNQF